MRILLDTNVVLDFLLQREPFFQNANQIFEAIRARQIVGYVTATTLTNIFYIARRQTRDIEQARRAVSVTLRVTVICLVDRAILEAAFASGLTDFEDAVQIACAIAQDLDGILTRDRQDFNSSPVPIFSTEDLLQRLNP
ncbi:PIN domain-containing protein [Leptolyngbya sp. NIES-2104]|uniref:PIN domain-containing protein n=1 Tax=Leptolyngbya sp. NIES-2104 TaxID=1552121 RepID=UPI0006EC6DD9|nr:PIN domain-containing protein [Leptolyngbya sp. NIES-2104]GAP93755.1 PIN domain protein [Leptolyngbya sp. NIES-2104]